MRLLLTNKFVKTSVFRRYMNTSVANRLPRGVANSERNQQRENEIPDQYVAGNQKTTAAHRDTRAIDSIDPVILKYTNLLNTSNTDIPQEKIHVTNFGAIRFDNENVPSSYGPSENFPSQSEAGIIGLAGLPADGTQTLGNDDKRLHQTLLLQREEVIGSKITRSNRPTGTIPVQVGGPIESNSSCNELDISYADRTTSNPRPEISEKHMSEDEKSFEELFGKSDEGITGTSNTKTTDTLEDAHEYIRASNAPSKAATTSESRSIGYIDEQFFNSSHIRDDSNVQVTPSIGTHLPLVANNRNPTPVNELPVGSTNDMNFIDEIYFKPSLDTIVENRTPIVEFSDIKEDLSQAIDSMNSKVTNNIAVPPTKSGNHLQNDTDTQEIDNIALSYLGLDPGAKHVNQFLSNKENREEKSTAPTPEDSPPSSAYEFVLKKRKEAYDKKFGFDGGEEAPKSKSTPKVLSLVRERTVSAYTKYEMLSLLKNSIIYDKNDVVGLYKPYGLAMHGGGVSRSHILTDFLPDLAKHLKTEELYPVHRLDSTTTGILLLARTPDMASTLKSMLKEQKIKKTYWAITKGIPKPLEGIIDIPIAEGTIEEKRRMVLRPDIDGFRGSSNKLHRAVTGYQVISKNVNTALIEVTPNTGVKHQVRVHLGFGLSCPVLGDHKYSHLKKMAPQRLPGDTLERLGIKQSKVRDLPMYLHSYSVLIPEINDGRNIFIRAKLPAYFNKTLSILKLNVKKNKVRYVGSECLDE